ncbi:MAG: glycosyltransferase family 4 protein [Acidobacteria bacterium]|nr:glycosyltransferase family 4 protein [Acidobacteriota bacterium]
MSGTARVCHIITMLELGGAQQNTLYTVAHLDRARFAPSLIAGPGGILDDEARAIPGLLFETCPHLARPISPPRDGLALADLARRLRRLRPHIVHTHSSKAGVLGRLAAFAAGVPVVVHTVHGWGFHARQNPVKRRALILAEQLASAATTHFIAVSEANARTGELEDIAPRRTFTVIRSGIDLARFRGGARSGALRRELGLGPEVPLAGMVACLKPQKAPLDFAAVAAQVAGAIPDAHFVLAGDGELRSDLERAVAPLGGRFHLLGWRRDPQVVVGDLDVLVLTSLHEGLPRVVPEAMSAGVPVVATAVDGTPEAVRDGENGWLLAPGDIAGLADSVARLLRDRDLARRMGQAGAARAAEWDIDEMVRRQELLYDALLRTRSVALT